MINQVLWKFIVARLPFSKLGGFSSLTVMHFSRISLIVQADKFCGHCLVLNQWQGKAIDSGCKSFLNKTVLS